MITAKDIAAALSALGHLQEFSFRDAKAGEARVIFFQGELIPRPPTLPGEPTPEPAGERPFTLGESVRIAGSPTIPDGTYKVESAERLRASGDYPITVRYLPAGATDPTQTRSGVVHRSWIKERLGDAPAGYKEATSGTP